MLGREPIVDRNHRAPPIGREGATDSIDVLDVTGDEPTRMEPDKARPWRRDPRDEQTDRDRRLAGDHEVSDIKQRTRCKLPHILRFKRGTHVLEGWRSTEICGQALHKRAGLGVEPSESVHGPMLR
jgi:hypothetical protein